ncbi:sensor histidine kinase [Paenibacillus alkalitolerans]|uniref:sensor histidine kinase n=1 Tax=Paenibacillus alkalitolerans TaxID=2799335 RepID=UPI0018F3D16B|nr:histidine kinase [Paenibacillus alkalitolerans]
MKPEYANSIHPKGRRVKLNTFKKMMLLIVILLTPIVMMYSYFNQTSIGIVEEEIRRSNLNRLTFFASQIDEVINQLSVFSIIVSKDPGMKELGNSPAERTPFDQLKLEEAIVNKLSLLSATSHWTNRLTVYLPKLKQALSSDYGGVYDPAMLQEPLSTNWEYNVGASGDGYFAKYITDPLNAYNDPEEAEFIIEVKFSAQNLLSMMQDFNQNGNGNSFLYFANRPPVYNQAFSNPAFIDELTAYLDSQSLEDYGYGILEIQKEQYIVHYAKAKSLNGYIIDYLPLQQILAPIVKNRNLFYGSIALLLLMSVIIALLLYRQVQIPIQWLVRGVRGIQEGKYSFRLKYDPNNEFSYLFSRFNEMAAQIQELIEKVYLENIRFREAKLKQLQSQINPHFLYNCLFFIKNMIGMGNKQAATEMVLNMASFYRYITRLENTMTTLGEEIELVVNYLNIQNLRMDWFHYELNIPEAMKQLSIPRLTVQPVVENAVVHGISASDKFGVITVTGEQEGRQNRIIIEDNGAGMSAELLQQLRQKVAQPADNESGIGLWNVHQRLFLQYKENGGLVFEPSSLGGLKVTIVWETAGE